MCGNPVETESDCSLVRRLKAGEVEAFDKLFDKYRRGILAYVDAMIRDQGVAEDITQECFLELVKRIDGIDPERGVSGWLYRVARNRAIEVIRHRKFEVTAGEEWVFEKELRARADPDAGPAKQMEAAESAAAVRRALQKLRHDEREILVLRFYSGLKFREIAGVIHRPLGTVLWKARKSLERMGELLDY